MHSKIDAGSLLLIGRIWRPHGVRGDVKVIPETDDPTRFSDLQQVYAGKTPDVADGMVIDSVRYQPTKKGTVVILKLEGVDSREAAEALRQLSIYAAADDLPPLADDEVFLHELMGLTVVTDTGVRVGVVEDVLELPAQEILVIGRENAAPAMVPVVDEFVVDIDVQAERIVIRPIEGLLE